jgi:uncharacterized protein YcnI
MVVTNREARMSTRPVTLRWFGSVLLVCTSIPGFAHVVVQPKQSAAGATEKYTVRVPNERAVATVRLEIEFPAAAEISAVDEIPGWKLELKKNASGRITGATWSDARLAPREVVEFTFTARNPAREAKLAWSAIQVYEDGSRSEWTGVEGSRTPASVTTILAAGKQH